jgi:hypothetical protein
MKTTTLKRIREFQPCIENWKKLLKSLGKTKEDDEPLTMSTIIESNGIVDAFWCLRAFYAEHRQTVIEFACECAEQVLPLWEEWAEQHAPEHLYAPRQAVTAARSGEAVEEALKFATEAARVAGDAAYAASVAQTIGGTASKQYSKVCLAADAARAAANAAAEAAQASCVKEANAAAGYARDAAYSADFIKDIDIPQRLIKHFG